MVPQERRHGGLPPGVGNAHWLRPAGLLALAARPRVVHRLVVQIRGARSLELGRDAGFDQLAPLLVWGNLFCDRLHHAV